MVGEWYGPYLFRPSLVGRCGLGVALAMLTVVIPAVSFLIKESNAKTEFFSARACYWAVVAGLVLMIIAAIGRTAASIIIAARVK